ncbi:hypothetical protein SAMN04489866_101275 [Peptococcus niger]|uniref:Uncharacterized protein n=1 Tax=Peptococcus niger TaxID=2741 RepID=A0A1G6SCA3_PEPNI|nr:hypothetical protein SAMN04489866_101275 [Peptococcus niger]
MKIISSEYHFCFLRLLAEKSKSDTHFIYLQMKKQPNCCTLEEEYIRWSTHHVTER